MSTGVWWRMWTSMLCIAAVPASAASQSPAVRSLLEMRRDSVVIQKWDISCGAAALATLLHYQHGDPVSEREVAAGLINRKEYLDHPWVVRARQGFSLLDLKRYVDARGYVGKGYGGLTFQDLNERAPMIVPVKLHGYRHFVVYRGTFGKRVLLGDPAFGNRTMPVDVFERAWSDDPKLGRIGFSVARRDGSTPDNRLVARPSDFTMLN